ncbi:MULTISPECIES: pyruvate kinase [Rhizobium/Agrobacterium group]|uniref:Pyruvate kinase n=2 Tax=Rhizobium/Agrobacterium group TaxID=227290 RepID=B9K3I3_ALLAM|nr:MULTISPECIES: pyruvate kinase [Rhizobium/Agrobacterium group]ACM39431.1 pyruvate kinase [Allorhizobium ampelinum S4]MCF1449047.1 pyruvate kinase [Allorhizobium ampelinum]MUO31232.1 pyruvate kinase [Agrobacterium vitis]MUO44939.1 pyruvate kinase [Agrobacterium vitis]MUP12938.1 pyruvate kinase [Agrobacterium vitis]
MFIRNNRRAKIVATVGPASHTPEILKSLFMAGVDTFRLNFSHGERSSHEQVFRSIRAIEQELGSPIGILQDLQGPKIRIGTIADGRLTLEKGAEVRFVCGSTPGTGLLNIPLPHREIFKAVVPGDDLLIDDGRVRVRVNRVDDNHIEAEVITAGLISNRKGVNIPGAVLDISPLTAKDREDLEFGLNLGVDWIALSFVQKARDMIEARSLVGDRAGLVAKIEKPSALDEIEDIVRLSDAIMVARGDLGVEIPPEDVPGRQKEIIRACRMAAKPVIVATQMLDSMVSSPTPTRAEASDVAGAIYDGADAVMLSAESATGAYPVEAVAMMDRIIEKTERHKLYRPILEATDPEIEKTPSHAVAYAAASVGTALNAPLILAFTVSGTTASRISRARPSMPILGVTQAADVARRMGLMWGVTSTRLDGVFDYERSVDFAERTAIAANMARPSDNIVIVAGFPFATSGGTNNLRVKEIKPRC